VKSRQLAATAAGTATVLVASTAAIARPRDLRFAAFGATHRLGS